MIDEMKSLVHVYSKTTHMQNIDVHVILRDTKSKFTDITE